ncbi:hypothetical protein DFH11DRAFT_1622252 [Phellopilus nigrolimitatus]|nr:hypothetical protein DFH11DRAFT_1622252 [Phellopilus nigrolimitatus]
MSSLTSERLRCDKIIEERRRSYSAESRFPDVFEDPIPSPVGPFTSADSAAMAEAFRKALWKPDFHSLSTYDLETIPDSEGKDRASETYSERPESIRRNGSHVQPASMIGERAGDLSSPTAVEGLISDRRNSSSPVTEIRAPTRATNDDTPPESPLPIFHSIHGTGDHHADYVYQICDPPPERSAPISRLTSPVLSDDDSELSAYPGDRIPSLRAKQSQSSISLSVQDDSVLEEHGRWDSKTSEGLRRRDSGTSEMLRRWESRTSESSTSAAIQIISRSPLTVPTASSSFDDLSPSSLSEQVHHISTQRSRNSSLSSMPGNVSVNPRAAFRPYITISPYCYTSMFLSSPDSVAALERLHSVHVSFRKSRSSGSKVDLFISANTSGNEEAAMPDILSAQWEIEKVVEFYNIFGTHMRTPSAPEA